MKREGGKNGDTGLAVCGRWRDGFFFKYLSLVYKGVGSLDVTEPFLKKKQRNSP